MKVYLSSIGCRLNQSEMDTVARQLLANGHVIVSDPTLAEKVIINTCAVTNEAAKDGRKLTRRIHRQNTSAEILLTGCYATIAPGELASVTGAGRIVSNKDKDQLVQILDPQAKPLIPVYEREPILRELLGRQASHTRAFIKVQDGCNNRCTFCITTIARGQSKSRRMGDIIEEIQVLATAGYQEAVLTGVHLGSYGQDLGGQENGYTETSLNDLVKAVLHHTDIPRLRLSSLEPWDIPPEFFHLWEDPRLLPHLHIPLQSGSDQILRRMARRTTRASFLKLATMARRYIPDLNLSTDLIVGFPGESEVQFRESFDYVKEVGFSRLHVFSYSRRPGTAAANMDGQVSKSEIKQRIGIMLDLGREMSLDFHRRYEGKTLNVLWEQAIGADNLGTRWQGYSDNYIRIEASGPPDLFNKVTATRLTGSRPDGMTGELLRLNSKPAISIDHLTGSIDNVPHF